MKSDYTQMWNDFGKKKAKGYYAGKFIPTSRVGLTNYMREKFIFDFLPLNKEMRVLDVGCASGKQVFEMAKRVKKAVGVDISPSFIDFAQKKAKEEKVSNVEFKVSKSEKLPFKDQSFDALLCSEVLEHVEDLESSFKELYRVTKKGGCLLITVPNLNSDGTLLGRTLRLFKIRKFEPLTEFNAKGVKEHRDTHVREFNTSEIKIEARKYGFEVLDTTTTSMIDIGNKPMDGLLRIKPLRPIFIWKETLLSKMRLGLGRNIILLCRRR